MLLMRSSAEAFVSGSLANLSLRSSYCIFVTSILLLGRDKHHCDGPSIGEEDTDREVRLEKNSSTTLAEVTLDCTSLNARSLRGGIASCSRSGEQRGSVQRDIEKRKHTATASEWMTLGEQGGGTCGSRSTSPCMCRARTSEP
jgi:hypothetical protein